MAAELQETKEERSMKGLVILDQLRLRLAAIAAVAGVFAIIVGSPAVVRAIPLVTPCSNLIYSCGCTITTPGVYLIENALPSSDGTTSFGDCIDVQASNVLLQSDPYADCETDLDGDTACDIYGPYSCWGAGINILRGASNVVVEDFQTYEWNVGVLDSGDGARINEFLAGNNCQAGVELNIVDGSNVGFFASGNLEPGQAQNYGVWLRNSSDSQVIESILPDNRVGIYLGCSDNGPTYPPSVCPKPGPSNRNYLAGNFALDNEWGIAVDLSDSNNIIDDNFAFGASGYGFDLLDNNPYCDHNLWYDNSFSTSNQISCAH
jgi:Periplasmic copper-binding protein (NosD)